MMSFTGKRSGCERNPSILSQVEEGYVASKLQPSAIDKYDRSANPTEWLEV
jgi:hypothetical protein